MTPHVRVTSKTLIATRAYMISSFQMNWFDMWIEITSSIGFELTHVALKTFAGMVIFCFCHTLS